MLLMELRNAWRGLRAKPAFSGLVIGVLAIGLGCVLYVAGMINGLIVEPLPFHAPELLFDAGLIDNDAPPDAERFDALRTDELLGWRDYAGSMAAIAGVGRRTINLSDGERPERHSGAAITANLLPVLGVQPALGRGFAAEEELPGAAPVVILSDRVWRERYLADPRIVGREIRVNARPARVVGVMPPDFSYPYREDVWVPATLARESTGAHYAVVLRPDPTVSMQQVRAALDAWLADAMRRDPEGTRSRARGIGLQPLAFNVVGRTTRALFWSMGAAVLLVLAIACANATNLLLTQTASRQQELWLRGALGAGRGRLVAHLLAQTSLLAGLALLIALPLAQGLIVATLAVFRNTSEDGPPQWMRFELDGRMLAFAAACALATAVVTAVLPALRAGNAGGSGARVHSGRGFARASRVLVVGEVALSCALLIAAAVMTQAVMRLDRFDLGFDTTRVLTARIALFEGRYPDAASIRGYQQRLRERLQRDPEVESVTLSTSLPGLIGEDVDVLERGLPRPPEGLPNVGYSQVDEHFAQAAGLQLVEGRFLERRDFAPGERAIVVDQTFAARFGHEGRVLGTRFLLESAGGGEREATVVGVVRPVQMDDIDDPLQPSVFDPLTGAPRHFSVLVRTRGTPDAYADGLMRAVAEVDPDTPAYWVRGYDAVLQEATLGVRMLSRIFGGFGLVALLLAAAGLYGVVAFAVAQRTREIGVRRALGAPDARVLASVGGRSLGQVGLGLVLGMALGLPFAWTLAAPLAHLVQVEASAWLWVLVTLAVVALFAVWLPARRALRVEPMSALRQD